MTAPVNDYENQLPKSTKSGQNQSSVHDLFRTVQPIITAKQRQNSTAEQRSGNVHSTTNHESITLLCSSHDLVANK